MLHVFDFVNMVPNIVSQFGWTKQKGMHKYYEHMQYLVPFKGH